MISLACEGVYEDEVAVVFAVWEVVLPALPTAVMPLNSAMVASWVVLMLGKVMLVVPALALNEVR